MKLWIDDVRPALEGWKWAKTYDAAKEAFESGEVTDASFDHDLGFVLDDEDCNFDVTLALGKVEYDYALPTGYDLALWVAANEKWPTMTCAVHSMNPGGYRAICAIIERYGPYTEREQIVYEVGNYKLRGVRYLGGENASTEE